MVSLEELLLKPIPHTKLLKLYRLSKVKLILSVSSLNYLESVGEKILVFDMVYS